MWNYLQEGVPPLVPAVEIVLYFGARRNMEEADTVHQLLLCLPYAPHPGPMRYAYAYMPMPMPMPM